MDDIPDGAAAVADPEVAEAAFDMRDAAPEAASAEEPETAVSSEADAAPAASDLDAAETTAPDDDTAHDESTSDADSDGFALPARIRHEETEALLAHLKAATADAPLAVDAAAVETLTTPAVLALVAAARARADAGAPLAVERPSAAFVDAFSDLGLFHDLMKMEFRT